MKKSSGLLMLSACVLLSGVPALAQTTNPSVGGGQNPHHEGHRMAVIEHTPSCQNIVTACKNAGYVSGEWKEGNGLFKDCFGLLVSGKGTPKKQVSVNASDVESCHSAMQGAHQQKKPD